MKYLVQNTNGLIFIDNLTFEKALNFIRETKTQCNDKYIIVKSQSPANSFLTQSRCC